MSRKTGLRNDLMVIQERSAKDAAAVKVLTVIGLIYLPTTIVAVGCYLLSQLSTQAKGPKNFFSTQFVSTDSSGDMRISRKVWLLAAIAIPLTVATFVTWGIWVHCGLGVL